MMYDEVGFAAVNVRKDVEMDESDGIPCTEMWKMKKSKSKQIYIISRLLYRCHVLCMTSGIPAIESKGHPYSFTTPMEDDSEHTTSFHDFLPEFSKPPKTNDDPGVYKENKNISFTFAFVRGANSSIDHITTHS